MRLPPPPIWTADEIETVRTMALNGNTDQAISDALGTRSRKAVASVRRRFRIPASRPQNGAGAGEPIRAEKPIRRDPLVFWWRKYPDIAAQAQSLSVEETMLLVVERVSR